MSSGTSTGITTARGWRRSAQAGHDAGDRRADVGSVVEHREGELDPVRRLADRDPFGARLAEQPPRALGEGLAVEACKRLGRAEARARPADEQDAGQLAIRHGSV